MHGARCTMIPATQNATVLRSTGSSGRIRAMSRILLFSDSHGVFAAMQALRARVEADAPDLVCFLGDEKRSIP